MFPIVIWFLFFFTLSRWISSIGFFFLIGVYILNLLIFLRLLSKVFAALGSKNTNIFFIYCIFIMILNINGFLLFMCFLIVICRILYFILLFINLRTVLWKIIRGYLADGLSWDIFWIITLTHIFWMYTKTINKFYKFIIFFVIKFIGL